MVCDTLLRFGFGLRDCVQEWADRANQRHTPIDEAADPLDWVDTQSEDQGWE